MSLGCGIYIYEAQLHFHTESFMRDQRLWCDIGDLDHPSAGGGRQMHVAEMGKTDNLAISSTSHSRNVLNTYIWGSVWYKGRERELSVMEVERYSS